MNRNRWLFAIAFALWVNMPTNASAAVWTDMWWNSGESGWGVNISHQYNAIFMSFFVYGQDGTAHWYTAAAEQGATEASGYSRFDGDLYETHGPYFGGPFNPSSVTYRKVGVASFVPSTPYAATVMYSVDGSVVTKPIERLSFRHIPLSGSYFGGYSVKISSCSTVPVGSYGTVVLEIAATVGADGLSGSQSTTISFDGTNPCLLAGTWRQYGGIYRITNTAACAAGVGTINLTDFSSSDDGIDGNMSIAGIGGCAVGVSFSAVRR